MHVSGFERVQNRISDIIHRFQATDGNMDRGDSRLRQDREPLRSVDSLAAQPARQTGRNFSDELKKIIAHESNKNGVSADLIKAVIDVESGGEENAVSKAGAIGLMQLMPGTARQLGVNPWNPSENVNGGIRYLKNLAMKYGNLDEILAAYNAGPRAVDRYGGIPPYNETRNYIRKIRKRLEN